MQSGSSVCSSNSLIGSAGAATLLSGCGLRFPPVTVPVQLSRKIANSTSSLSLSVSPSIRLQNCRPALTTTTLRSTASHSPQIAEEMASNDPQDPRLARISSAIRVIPNFPKPGIMFQDITTLLLDTKAFKDTIDLFVERYRDQNISVVAGIEARGFIFGPPIALAIGAKFVPMRKPNKLPGAVQPGERALVIDDLIATGGTLCAAIKLLERVGVHVVECACVIELPELKGRERLGDKSLFVLVDGA